MKIFWTHTAIRQRTAIFNYWNERNGSNIYTDKLKRKIKQRLTLLKRFPYLGKQSKFAGFRFIAMGNFSLYYSIEENGIFISSFWDNRQDPNKLLDVLH